MRCQKVRSYLSAYCNGELTGRKRLVIDEHLSDCAGCRKEEAIYYSLNNVKTDIGSLKVSDKFNDALLNRIAQERFAETRTKAYMPSRPPVLTWGRVLPSVITAMLAVVVTAFVMQPDTTPVPTQQFASVMPNSSGKQLDDSYMYVTPIDNPNMTINLNKNWSLNEQMRRAERVQNISNNLTNAGSFASPQNSTLASVQTRKQCPIPFDVSYYHVRPVYKVYIVPNTNNVKEDSGDY